MNMNLQQQQLAFSAWIRDPGRHTPPADVAQRRMAIYRELFFNNIRDTLINGFPVLRQTLSEQHFDDLCADFFAHHHCHTPYLSHVPGEFVDYLAQRHDQPDWLHQLALWEWTELELFLAPDIQLTVSASTDLLNEVPLLSPLIRMHRFHYPVHEIGPGNIPSAEQPSPCQLLAWRNIDNHIGFMQLNALSALLVERMQDNRILTGNGLLSEIAAQQSQYDAASIIDGGRAVLENFYHRNIIIGSQPVAAKETGNDRAFQ